MFAFPDTALSLGDQWPNLNYGRNSICCKDNSWSVGCVICSTELTENITYSHIRSAFTAAPH